MKVKQGNKELLEKEFEEFFQANYSRFYYYALRYIPDSETCKDLVGDSFQFMWERIETFRMDTALTYMYTHLHHLCIDYLRRQEKLEDNKLSYLSMLREWNDDDRRESEARIVVIMRLIEEMPPLTRTVMEQCYVYKKMYREVAQLTGLSESGVRKHVMKGLNIIRQYFSVKYKKGGNYSD